MLKRSLLFLPLLLFVLLATFLWRGLSLDPKKIPTTLINHVAPRLGLPSLGTNNLVVTQDFKGQIWLLNIWASWCAACLEEQPTLLELAKKITIIGLAYKDSPQEAKYWLKKYGNPFSEVIIDKEGLSALDWGVYGAPETFVIDRHGKVRYKHVGIIHKKDWQHSLLPLIEKLRDEA